jgi:putative endonuclease
MEPDNRSHRGAWGEALAAAFLQGLGYEILARNLRLGRLEVDLLARAGQVLVLVEVRLRSGTRFGRPEETVDWRKRRHLAEAWARLLSRHPEARWIRMDIVSVLRRGRREVTLRHYPNAWVPPGARLF